jgi:integrase
MQITMRYVEARRRKDGTHAYYWRRRGWPVVRLPDGEAERYARALELTRASDAGRPLPGVKGKAAPARKPAPAPRIEPGSAAALMRDYQKSATFKALGPSTQANYRSVYRLAERVLGPLPIDRLTRRVCVAFLDGYDGDPARDIPARPGAKKTARIALASLFAYAENTGWIEPRDNPLRGYKLGQGTGARRRFASTAEIRALEAAAPTLEPWLLPALRLLLYTGQRPGDLLQLTRANLKDGGRRLELTQSKTGTFVRIPLHKHARSALAAQAEADQAAGAVALDPPLIHDAAFRPIPYQTFNRRWRSLLKAAGIARDLQARDFRRTAVVSLAELGCSTAEIAAITGHRIAETQRILDTYFVATDALGDAAIEKWEGKA